MSDRAIDRLALASAVLMGCMVVAFLMESRFIPFVRSIPTVAYFLIGVGTYFLSFILGLIATIHFFRKEHKLRWKPFLLILPSYLFTLYLCVGLIFAFSNNK